MCVCVIVCVDRKCVICQKLFYGHFLAVSRRVLFVPCKHLKKVNLTNIYAVNNGWNVM